MKIRLYNSLTKKKEEFIPADPKQVGMYVCGPTVYDRAHIGNARAVVVFDVLYRVLCSCYGDGKVKYVRNITDVDDKINAAARARGISINELTVITTKMFHDDMGSLNCLSPDVEPRATEHIDGMIQMCELLINNGNAYEVEGHVLFSVVTDENYGHLSRRSKDEMIAGARVEVAPYKKDPADFVLWKPSNDEEPGWDSPWGRGRPGWHIECSVMSSKYLGTTFDIHGGGADLQFPHHENEIAQSCCAYPESKFARYWVHNGFLSVEGEKMSKSLGNFVTVNDLLQQNVAGEVIRYALMATHYRKPLDWSGKSVTDARKALDKFYSVLDELSEELVEEDVGNDFIEALYDDLNTPKAIAMLHSLCNAGEVGQLRACANMLGLLEKNPSEWSVDVVNNVDKEWVEAQIEERKQARLNKDWATSDRIRDELQEKGVVLKDNVDGTTDWEVVVCGW